LKLSVKTSKTKHHTLGEALGFAFTDSLKLIADS